MKRGREVILFLLVVSGLGGAGCAAASLAAAPVVTALQAIGGRTVERTVSADLHTTWTATVDTFARMEVRLEETDQGRETWEVEGRGDAVILHATLTRVTPQMTKISLRAETAGLLADKQTADEILNQVARSLERPAALAAREVPDERDGIAKAVTALQGEIRHLKAVIDKKDKKQADAYLRPGAKDRSEDIFSGGHGVLVVPPSYGVPVLPAPPDPSNARVPPSSGPDEYAGALSGAPLQTDSDGHGVVASPLIPVEVLTPVWSLDGRQGAR